MIETLATKSTDRHSFTPSLSGGTVNLTTVAKILYNADGKDLFTAKDSLRLVSIAFLLPYQFNLADSLPYITLQWINSGTGAAYDVLPYSASKLLVHDAGYELLINQLVTFPATTAKCRLTANVLNSAGAALPISNISAPSDLNGSTVYATVAVKVDHTVALT